MKDGTKTLMDLANFMLDIPAIDDCDEMEGSGMAAAFKKVTGHWG